MRCTTKIIRNDDVAFDTDINELKQFCEICDKYNFKILQAITVRGICIPIDVANSDEYIKSMSYKYHEQ